MARLNSRPNFDLDDCEDVTLGINTVSINQPLTNGKEEYWSGLDVELGSGGWKHPLKALSVIFIKPRPTQLTVSAKRREGGSRDDRVICGQHIHSAINVIIEELTPNQWQSFSLSRRFLSLIHI